MNVEIAICTFNRAEFLKATLGRLASIQKPSDIEFRIIVVDNNSSDNSVDIVASAQQETDIELVSESRQGHCFARNAAIDSANGEFLIWIDDDVLVSDTWLESYLEAFRSQEETSFWGGPIFPVFNHQKPDWIDQHWDKISGCFAYRDLGKDPIEFTAEVLPYGANFAVRTQVQKEFRFETELGRSDRLVLGEDELELMRRLLDGGFHGKWIPGATVNHVIDSQRTTETYVQNYFIGQGRAMIARNRGWDSTLDELRKESKHEIFCYRMKRFFAPAEVWLSHLIRGSLAQGQLDAMIEKTR